MKTNFKKAGKIKYRIKGLGCCLTPCPFGMMVGPWKIYVGSMNCRVCKYFSKDDKINMKVSCKHK